MIDPDELKGRVKCCACQGSFENSEKLNLVALMKVAQWPNPAWGNLILRVWGFAIAVVCDNCVKKNNKIRFAVEWDNNGRHIKYHPVDELLDVPPEIFKPLDMLEPGRHGIAG